MQKITSLIIPLFFLGTLNACSTASIRSDNTANQLNHSLQKDGSPYRFHTKKVNDDIAILQKQLIGQPCQTAADTILKNDILIEIKKNPSNKTPVAKPVLKETKCLAKTGNKINEIWIVQLGEKQAVYTIYIKPDPKGGAFFGVNGPW